MGQKRIVIDLTEYQARILRMAVMRFNLVAPSRLRTRMFSQKLRELVEVVDSATADLEVMRHPVPPIPTRRWGR